MISRSALLLLLLTLPAAAQVHITVTYAPHHPMNGFGATHGTLVYAGKDNLTPELRARAIDAAYGQVHLTLGNVPLGVFETPRGTSDTWGQRRNDDADPRHYEWSGFNWDALNATNARLLQPAMPKGFTGFYPANSISTRWEQTWLTPFLSSDYQRFLDECGEHVCAGLHYWRDTLGLPMTLMMLFNEPLSGNGELVGGSAATVVDIIKAVGQRMRSEGITDVRFVVPGEETEEKSLSTATAILNDPVARSFVGAIAYHTYPYGSVYSDVQNVLATSGAGKPDRSRIAVRASLRALAETYGIPLWMTEVSHGAVAPRSMDALRGRAIHIHDELLYAGASAYFCMQNMWDVTSQQMHFGNKDLYGSEGTPVLIDNDSAKVTITGIGYAIGHYARWLSPDAVHTSAVSDDSLVQCSSFTDAVHSTFVLINNAAAARTCTVRSFVPLKTGTLEGEQSYLEDRWKPLPAGSGGVASEYAITLPAQSVTTVRFENAATDAVEGAGRPADLALEGYPNPAHGPMSVSLRIAQPGSARVVVSDVLGRAVAVLHDGSLSAGVHQWVWDVRDAPAGTYIVRVITADAVRAMKVCTVR